MSLGIPKLRAVEVAVEIEMRIRGLAVDANTNTPVVILKQTEGDALLPIWLGIHEAHAIAIQLQGIVVPRPMTHDLLKILLMSLEAGIKKVVVSELKENTFYALIWLEREGELIAVDSRPSDALALALRVDCPIYVEENILQAYEISMDASTESDKNEELRKWLDNLDDKDVGGYKM
jgi:bifunctional DNase/RNase